MEPEILTPTQIKFLKEEIDFHELIEQQFNRFFISYSLSFNKMYVRKGHLFNRPFKRIEITDNSHFTQTIIYIHTNAQHHRILKDFRDWRWSSYHSFISTLPTLLNRTEVLEWFGSKAEFIKTHIEKAGYFYDTPFE